MTDINEVEQIELSIEEAKKMVALKDAVEKLSSNREFRKLFVEGYFKTEAVRLTTLLADPSMQQHRDDILASLEAISMTQRFLRETVQMGRVAEGEIREFEEALEETRAYEDSDTGE